jgi:hypothetical protein
MAKNFQLICIVFFAALASALELNSFRARNGLPKLKISPVLP